MLNRLFVIVGVLVILAIGSAFVVPRFIQWSDYRGRLEAMAGEAFGAEVAITGDISLTLLPQPQLVFTSVRVGPEAAPAMRVGRVEADFSLFDFLSDRYRITRLLLDQPEMLISVDAGGAVGPGLALAARTEESLVSIANADVVNGRLQVADARSAETHVVEAIRGQLRLDALRGPLSFQGDARFADTLYAVRLATGQAGTEGATTLSLHLQPQDRSFVLEATGAVQSGAEPRFTGALSYRQPPPAGEGSDAGRGDLLLEGQMEATTSRILLSDYVLVPDENRAATRLTGAAELNLGTGTAFNAVLSGGVIALPPRDATQELTDPPYEIVRLLEEMPLPPIPPVAGRIGLDITELNLRGVSLRNVRLDATTDANSWTIQDFSAGLQGDTILRLTGNLSAVDGHAVFAGGLAIATEHLDRLAALWRPAPPGDPLVNMPGSLQADVALSSERLTISAGTLLVAGINQGFEVGIGFAPPRALELEAHFTTLSARESAAIAALFPDLRGSGSFGATFPRGSVDLSASRATLFGLDGSDLALRASWDGGVVELSRLHAGDLGGGTIDARLTAFGTLLKPELSGAGTLRLLNEAPLLTAALDGLQAPPALADFLHRSLPANLDFQLEAPAGDGSQALSLTGRLGTADTRLEAELSGGIAAIATSPMSARLRLASTSPTMMTMQLGLGAEALFQSRTAIELNATIDGVPANSYEVHAELAGGGDHIRFDGNVVPGDFTAIGGQGQFDVALADPSPFVAALGADGVHVPGFAGRARVQFSGLDSVRLADIEAGGVTGELAMTRRGEVSAVSGALAVPDFELGALLPLLVGAAGTIPGDEVWPAGPIDIGIDARGVEGRVDIAAAAIHAGGRPLLEQARFTLGWDGDSVSLRNLAGRIGPGEVTADVTICCAHPALPDRRVSGRIALNDAPLDRLLPDAVTGIGGVLDASAQFDGTGVSLAAAMQAMTGSGSYTVSDFTAAQFDPQAFNGAAEIADVVDMTPEALAAAITQELIEGPFEAGTFTGSFTIAGGTLRSPNVAIAGRGARIFGGGSVRLADLSIDARYTMSPTILAARDSLLDASTAQVAASISGPLWAPQLRYDVTALVDNMKIRASEIELARLEQLQREDEERRRQAAEERARVAAEQAAAEEARREAEAAARRAAEERAAREAAERAAQPPQVPFPLDLGLN